MVANFRWHRYPYGSSSPHVKEWIELQSNMQLAPNTLEAYARGLEDFLSFCSRNHFDVLTVTREHVSLWVRDLGERFNPNRAHILIRGSGVGLSNATKSQRLTALRLFYDYLCEEGVRNNNPVGRAVYAPSRIWRGKEQRGGIHMYQRLPRIPTEDEWLRLLTEVRKESLRNRLMFTLQYECALRREELCLLREMDFDPAHRALHIPGTITKSGRSRVVVYFSATARLYAAYLRYRRRLQATSADTLFLSESRRNFGQPLTVWTWTKVVERLAAQARVAGYTTHTARHLRLTDLARAGWEIHEIAAFAGHRMTNTTLLYIHASGRELTTSYARATAGISRWREKRLQSLYGEKD